jgi:hypothetical protein
MYQLYSQMQTSPIFIFPYVMLIITLYIHLQHFKCINYIKNAICPIFMFYIYHGNNHPVYTSTTF